VLAMRSGFCSDLLYLQLCRRSCTDDELQIAKQDLAIVRQTHPFDLTLWNIRSPPPEVDAGAAKRWRRLYQYDIVSSPLTHFSSASVVNNETSMLRRTQPVLHLGEERIQKHRIDRPQLIEALEGWSARQLAVVEDEGVSTKKKSAPASMTTGGRQ
jgi:hypothetical protein